MALWPHQEEAVYAITNELGRERRAQVVMACGTGKTRVAAAAADRMAPHGKVLILVPTLELLAQSALEWATHAEYGLGTLLAVCSDRTATARVHQHLGELAGLITTSSDQVANRLEKRHGRVTVFVTYQSLSVIEELHAMHGVRWDLAVIDEAHRATGYHDRAWSSINDDDTIPADRRLYMTATPRIVYSTSTNGRDVVGMDDVATFGRRAHVVSFAEAIEAGLLADYRVVVSVATDADVGRLAAERALVEIGGQTVPTRMAAAQVALARAIREFDLQRVLTYHNQVLTAMRFSATLAHAIDLMEPEDRPKREVAGLHVTGKMTPYGRRYVLDKLAHPDEGCVVVANARLLAEGVDVPELDGVMFADPRSSQIDIVQAVGRALRRGATIDKVATVIVPIFLADGENPAAALDGSRFDTVWRVLRALRAHDERLGLRLDEERAQHPRQGEPDSSRPWSLPDWLTLQGAVVDSAFAAAVRLRIVEKATNVLPEVLAQARAFHADHGHLRVSIDDERYPKLNNRLHYVRRRYRQGDLDPAYVEAFESLDIEQDGRLGQWSRGLEELRAYHAEHGHVRVPHAHVMASGFKLGQWLGHKQASWQKGTLPAERIADLEKLGVEPRRTVLHDTLREARAFYAEYGHLTVPPNHERYPNLRSRIAGVRRRYRQGRLDAEYVDAFESLDMEWDRRLRQWNRGLEELRAYHAEHGHVRVPRAHVTASGFKLGEWLGNKRGSWRRGSMQPEKIAELEKFGVRKELDSGQKSRAALELDPEALAIEYLSDPGLTFDQLADRYGTTGHLISESIRKQFPHRNIVEEKRALRRQFLARKETQCTTCDGPAFKRHGRFTVCSSRECQEMLDALKRLINYTQTSFTRPGTRPYRTAVEAHRRGLPIFDRLPAGVQKQIRDGTAPKLGPSEAALAALRAAARDRSASKMRAAQQAISGLQERGSAITFRAVQLEAGVSHSFLYNNEELRRQIKDLRHTDL